MSGARYLARPAKVAARMIGGEMMIMSGENSSLYSLNETATILWQAADGVTPLAQIVEERICASFDVDADTALRDCEALAQELARQGILLVSDVPVPPSGPSSKVSP
jgi:hypothetical protein